MKLQTNKDLHAFNTLAIPSTVSHFVSVASLEEVIEAVTWAVDAELAIYVLGGGSNVILEPNIEALIIKVDIRGIRVGDEDDGSCLVQAGAGENWHELVEHCTQSALYGIENLALIPGNVGAAPIQNIGAYGVELKDVFYELEALEIVSLKVRRFSCKACDFSYRESIFKNRLRNQFIILTVTLCLRKTAEPVLSYPALRQAVLREDKTKVSPLDVMKKVIEIRRSKLPDPKLLPNAGSFFKNPIISREQCEALKKQFKDLISFDVGVSKKKLAAAWLIEKAGWKGAEKYGVKVHSEHALVITNPHFCGSDEVMRAVSDIQKDVNSLFGVELELEPQRMV